MDMVIKRRACDELKKKKKLVLGEKKHHLHFEM